MSCTYDTITTGEEVTNGGVVPIIWTYTTTSLLNVLEDAHLPNLCMVAQQDALQHNGLAGGEAGDMWLREGFVKIVWKQNPLKIGSTLRVRSVS